MSFVILPVSDVNRLGKGFLWFFTNICSLLDGVGSGHGKSSQAVVVLIPLYGTLAVTATFSDLKKS